MNKVNTKFKVGDRVKVVRKDETNCGWSGMDSTLGKEGYIKSIYSPNTEDKIATYKVDFIDTSLNPGSHYWVYNENCLELVETIIERVDSIYKDITSRKLVSGGTPPNKPTQKELLQALLDGYTLQWHDLRTYLEPNGSITTVEGKTKYISHDFLILDAQQDWKILPKTIDINGYKVPEPYHGELDYNVKYFYPYLSSLCNTCYQECTLTVHRRNFADNLQAKGLLHKTQEAAELHAKALLSFTQQ